MYAAQGEQGRRTFDFATGLIHDNLLFVDRETKSVWSQLDGKAVIGDLKGQPLDAVPALQTTWGYWRQQHPNTKVLVAPGSPGADYLYFNPDVGAARPQHAEFGHNPAVLGLGVSVGGQSMFLPWRKIRGAKKPIDLQLGAAVLTVHVAKKGLTAWVLDADGETVPSVMTYRKSWLAFRPESATYGR